MKRPPYYVGDPWTQRIRVIDPNTEQPVELTGKPTCVSIAPDGTENAIIPTADGDSWIASVHLTVEGIWHMIVTTLPPFDDVEQSSVYANPLPRHG